MQKNDDSGMPVEGISHEVGDGEPELLMLEPLGVVEYDLFLENIPPEKMRRIRLVKEAHNLGLRGDKMLRYVDDHQQ